jgi:hypothetical protein
VLYRLPGAELVSVRRDVEYRTIDAGALTLDVYTPPGTSPGTRLPSVVLAVGFSDIGARAMLGCAFKEFESFASWARLIAASGMAAVTYTTGKDPAADARALLGYVRGNAAVLGLDEKRIGLWACSGHGPTALSLLIEESAGPFAAAALLYAYTLDLGGATRVAEAAKSVRFANPTAGRNVEDLPPQTPIFLARAGQDATPGLNETLDRFLAAAVARNLPVAFVNHPAGPHAFDLMDDSEASRRVIRGTLAFLEAHLKG